MYSFVLLTFFVVALRYHLTNSSSLELMNLELHVLHSSGNKQKQETVALPIGSSLSLICQTALPDQSLSWQYAILNSATFYPVNTTKHVFVSNSGPHETTLRLTDAQVDSAGTYRCSNGIKSQESSLHIYGIAEAVDGVARVVLKKDVVGQQAFMINKIDTNTLPVMSCKFAVGRNSISFASIRWTGGKLKDNPSLYELSFANGLQEGYISSNLTLLKPTADRELYGTYNCSLNIIPGEKLTATVSLKIDPVIKPSEGVFSYYSDNKFTHTCEVIAYPPVVHPVQWTRNNSTIIITEVGKYHDALGTQFGDHFRMETAYTPFDSLVFDPLRKEDRALYCCYVENEYGNATAAFFLRVKDKWSIAWPLGGIIVEVLILVVIICVYEVRTRARVKRAKESEDIRMNTLKESNKPYGSDVGFSGGDRAPLRQRVQNA